MPILRQSEFGELGNNVNLSSVGTISKPEIEKTYKISRRIEAEERGLDSAMMVFTSTQQEVDEQWGLYEGYGPRSPHLKV